MTEKKLHVALLFGGNSSEHDVSKRSAHNIYDGMDKDKYDVSIFMFTKDGILLDNEASQRIFDGEPEDQVVQEAYQKMDLDAPLAPIAALSTVKEIDFFYPVIHGNLGEDGTVQGLFRLLKKPYIGSGIASSAMSFDKDLTKRILNQAGIRNTKYLLVTPQNKDQYSWSRIKEELGDLVFVKPAKQGSSVGIHKVDTEEEYETAMKDAFTYDYKVLVEAGIKNPREIEISILGNENPIASKLGGIRVPEGDEFYDYENKFVDASGVVFDLPVIVDDDLAKEITDMALKAYEALGMKGMARIDFLVDEDGVPYLGEPNTLPGFTNISLYPQMWNISGISYSELIDRLIQLGIEEFEYEGQLRYDFKALGVEKVGEKRYN
ncbi:D-alanine--D-alanine ligase [Limosilactobacillus fermentum]|uniref:D-alanine--D-alanine ligase n=1 Tax=Limosilactobacillus fermentum (strain NBRC 3956 / LMG 18251) TaxID=334390 RepID=DDL_LIMF3|nr:D-alanine--D-alanine ligase family protein [Limosilactobacillus fermentum]B2GAV5.1 RecName: Full=D-alanine--D-alanine ligase; AltName: Full=D-Ala-D-Ala ligase; AltName: Full=D-alanylalanine synthetase [Limosilactobacillus fermentum IFO 3956]BAG26787.1 D-alanine-D-alanine ligase [Limosilactobacillus fermentum IFO 3956]GEA96625.1 D-alanine--D-alanine ligase [Limosilactobacillus fermentum]